MPKLPPILARRAVVVRQENRGGPVVHPDQLGAEGVVAPVGVVLARPGWARVDGGIGPNLVDDRPLCVSSPRPPARDWGLQVRTRVPMREVSWPIASPPRAGKRDDATENRSGRPTPASPVTVSQMVLIVNGKPLVPATEQL